MAAQKQRLCAEQLMGAPADKPLRTAHIGHERVIGASFLQFGQQIQNRSDGRCQDNKIGFANGLDRVRAPLINHFPANGPLHDLATIAADTPAPEARFLKRQPPRSTHQPQADNRDAAKDWF